MVASLKVRRSRELFDSEVLGGDFYFDGIETIAEQLTLSSCSRAGLCQTEVVDRAETHPALAAVVLISEQPTLRAAWSNLQIQPARIAVVITSLLAKPLHTLCRQSRHCLSHFDSRSNPRLDCRGLSANNGF